MAFEIPKESYKGKIREVTLGTGDKAKKIGGFDAMPPNVFEGNFPNKPLIAMEVYDSPPKDWAPAAVEPFKDVLDDPVAWAKKCVEEYGAEAIVLQLVSADPNADNKPSDEVAQIAKNVADAIDVPLIVMGCGNADKDAELLPKVCELCQGKNITVGFALEENHKRIAASALGYGHNVIAQAPIDVNLQKQLNILISNLGLPLDRVIMEPSTGALGYGIEYTYSVMERIMLAALAQGDDMMQCPICNDMGKECWKTKEAKASEEEEPAYGDRDKRGKLWEILTGVSLLLAGAQLLFVRHPESASYLKKFIDEIYG